jgi:hypothetical protein
MVIDGFTISYSFDAGNPGRRASNMVSVNFKLPSPMPIEEIETVRLEASKKVTMWAIQDAMLRGEISQDDAKERLEVLRLNFDGMKSALEKRNSK